MATPTYDLLDSTTLASSAFSVTFSSLDTLAAGYRDLVLVMDYASSDNYYNNFLRFNGDSGSNYYYVTLEASGFGPNSILFSSVDQIQFGNSYTSNSTALIQLFDFATTDKQKPVLSRSGNANLSDDRLEPPPLTNMIFGRWENTSAITSIELISNDLYIAGSTFKLYGIAG